MSIYRWIALAGVVLTFLALAIFLCMIGAQADRRSADLWDDEDPFRDRK